MTEQAFQAAMLAFRDIAKHANLNVIVCHAWGEWHIFWHLKHTGRAWLGWLGLHQKVPQNTTNETNTQKCKMEYHKKTKLL